MIVRLNPNSNPKPTGPFSHGIITSGSFVQLFVSGQVGLRADGTVGADIKEQTEIAWSNVRSILSEGDMDIANIVKVNTYLTDENYLSEYNKVRSIFLGEHRPASTLLIVKALVRPEWFCEVEVHAIRKPLPVEDM